MKFFVFVLFVASWSLSYSQSVLSTKDKKAIDPGLIFGDEKTNEKAFIKAIASHRVWEREKPRLVPA